MEKERTDPTLSSQNVTLKTSDDKELVVAREV